jgi:hypothetical protein
MSYKIIFIVTCYYFLVSNYFLIYIFDVLVVIWMSYTKNMILATSPIYREGDDLLLAHPRVR